MLPPPDHSALTGYQWDDLALSLGSFRDVRCTISRPAYPKTLLSVLQTAYVRIFRFLTRSFFLQMHHQSLNQSKQNSVKGQFCIIHLVRTVGELTSSIIQMHYTWTTLFCLCLRKLFLVEDHKTPPKTMHPVCCFCWCWHVLSWTVVVWSEFVSLVSCILPPLHQFLAATHHQQLLIQTRHIRKMAKFRSFNAKSMFIGLTNFFDHSGLAIYFSPGNDLKYAMSLKDNSPSTFYDRLHWQRTSIRSH